MHVIALSNQKGGCGKTTTAINLAASLASLGKRTLLMDLDPQAHASFGLGMRGDKVEASVYNVLTDQEGKRKYFLEDVIVPIETQLDLVPSHILLSTIEQEFTNKDESVSRLREALGSLSFPYQFVILDCPPSLGFLTFNALRAADTVIVPIELSSFSLMGVSKLLSMIELLRVKMQHTPKVYALPTMVDMRTRFSKHILGEIQRAFGENILSSPVRQTVVVRESQAKGRSLLSYDKKSKGAMDYLILSQEVLSKIANAPETQYENPRRFEPVPGSLRDFIFKTQGAREVHLVGDFNHWRISNDSLLWQKEEGLWQKKVFLEPGRHRYKFVIDGQWTTDPSNDRLEPNPYGGLDSIVEIE
ncbi:MAG: AAA family ATPase [Candidatus Omnitrophica bacterium]|nr:AAA family ATPase [Candidatus Omnitrophota bacterium]